MAPALHRVTFTTHIASSVGWVGAVMAFVAIAVIGFTSDDESTARGAYLVMAPAAWFVLVPPAHASLISGRALSLGPTRPSSITGRPEAADYGVCDRDPATG